MVAESFTGYGGWEIKVGCASLFGFRVHGVRPRSQIGFRV